MSDSETSERLLTPELWMRTTGIRVVDADGWRTMTEEERKISGSVDGLKDWEVPITRDEFMRRALSSTIMRYPDPPYDERPAPPDEFVSRLAEALKSEFGAQFGMGINAVDETWKRVADGIARKMRCEEEIETYLTDAIVFRFNQRVSE